MSKTTTRRNGAKQRRGIVGSKAKATSRREPRTLSQQGLKGKRSERQAQDRQMVSAFTWPGKGFRHSSILSNVRSIHRWITSWVYTCVDRNATAVAQHALHLYRQTPSPYPRESTALDKKCRLYLKSQLGSRKALAAEEILDHPFLKLMAQPNPLLDYFGLLWLTVCYLQSCGEAFWKICLDDEGMPCELWPLPAQFVYPILGPKQVFDNYELRMGAMVQVFPAEEIVHFRKPSPLDTLSGFGNLRGVLESAETNIRMQEYQRALFDNMAVPDFLLTPKEETTADQINALRQSWNEEYQGWLKRGQAAVAPFPMEVESLTMKNSELEFKDGRIIIRDEIAAGFGVPIPIIAVDGTTFSNYAVGMQVYMRNTILPMQTCIAGRINKDMMPYYAPREGDEFAEVTETPFFVFFDNPVPEDVAATTDKLTKLVGAGVYSPNRALAELGEDPVSWGDQPWLNAGLRTPLLIEQQVAAEVAKVQAESEARKIEGDSPPSLSDLANAVSKLVSVGDVELANVLRDEIARLVGVEVVAPLTETPEPQLTQQPFGGPGGDKPGGDKPNGNSKPKPSKDADIEGQGSEEVSTTDLDPEVEVVEVIKEVSPEETDVLDQDLLPDVSSVSSIVVENFHE